jgi:hypothetical protein
MIYLLNRPTTPRQVQDMLEVYPILVKIVVDIRRRMLAGGGEMHAESLPRFSGHCEALLLADGSEQDDLWGANWYPAEQRIEFESLINIRPRLGNRSILIQNDDIRRRVAAITRELLGGVQ